MVLQVEIFRVVLYFAASNRGEGQVVKTKVKCNPNAKPH